jgi:hypothetical protein
MSNYNPWQTSASQYGGPDAWKARPPVGKGKGQVTSKMAEEARRNVVNLPGTYERTSDLTGGHAQDFVQDAERERRRKFNITGSGHQQHASSSSAYRYEGGASGTRRTQQQSGRVGGGGGTRGPGGGAGAAGPRYHSPAPAMGGATHRVANGVNRAVFVGVNYIGGEAPLTGCINDVNNAMSHLQKWGFSASEKNNFRMLTEEEPDQRRNGPTKKNILEAIAWLVSGATPGETLFFHFSGTCVFLTMVGGRKRKKKSNWMKCVSDHVEKKKKKKKKKKMPQKKKKKKKKKKTAEKKKKKTASKNRFLFFLCFFFLFLGIFFFNF